MKKVEFKKDLYLIVFTPNINKFINGKCFTVTINLNSIQYYRLNLEFDSVF